MSTTLGASTSVALGLFLEMFLSAQLMLAVLFLALEKHKATFLAPLGIGASLFVAHLVGVPFTGASLNPARSFGPAVLEGFPSYPWIYWLGPCMGAALASFIYSALGVLQFRLANPTQDFNDAGV
jgi:aquaporin rerated protein, other eukaryote